MPTYEYLCASCGHRFETWQRITEDPLTKCPECGGEIKRVLFPAGIVFKGSGFYATDSRSASSASSPADSASASSSGEGSSSAKSNESTSPSDGTSGAQSASESTSGSQKAS